MEANSRSPVLPQPTRFEERLLLSLPLFRVAIAAERDRADAIAARRARAIAPHARQQQHEGEWARSAFLQRLEHRTQTPLAPPPSLRPPPVTRCAFASLFPAATDGGVVCRRVRPHPASLLPRTVPPTDKRRDGLRHVVRVRMIVGDQARLAARV
jgi:hypothetical protein